jgi:quercetin dioxygenase-like cupin family protein
VGDLNGTVYEFPLAGDVLPRHAHTEDNAHITIVTRGKVRVVGDTWEIEGVPGSILDFKPHVFHEIIAAESNSCIVNIVKKYGGDVGNYLVHP